MNHDAELLPNTTPGEMLRVDFLEPMGISAYKVAKGTGLSPIHVSEILKGKRHITPMTSVLLGRFFGMSPEFWLNLQNRHDLIDVQRNQKERIERVIAFKP